MEYRRLGRSDLVTSVIGFGGFPIGRGQYGPFDDDEAIGSIHRAIDLGVTLIDTAAGYGRGEGEKLVGRALKGRRHDVVLVSKGSTAPDKMAADLEGSLQRLQTDYLDLYLIHWPDASVPIADSMGAMAEFQRQVRQRANVHGDRPEIRIAGIHFRDDHAHHRVAFQLIEAIHRRRTEVPCWAYQPLGVRAMANVASDVRIKQFASTGHQLLHGLGRSNSAQQQADDNSRKVVSYHAHGLLVRVSPRPRSALPAFRLVCVPLGDLRPTAKGHRL